MFECVCVVELVYLCVCGALAHVDKSQRWVLACVVVAGVLRPVGVWENESLRTLNKYYRERLPWNKHSSSLLLSVL